MKKMLLLLVVLCANYSANCQDSALVRWYVKGSETFYIKLNDSLLPLNYYHKIPQGEYDLEIFSPTYKLYSGSLSTQGKSAINYVAELQFDDAYRTYLLEYDIYKKKILRRQTIPALIGTFGILSSPIFYLKAKSSHQEYVQNRFLNYYLPLDNSTSQLRTRYVANQTMFALTGAMALGGIGTFILLRKGTTSMKKPVFKQENPFTLEMINIGYSAPNDAPTFGFTLTF